MIEAEARITTTVASRLLQDIALNWSHRYPVRYDAMTAEVEMSGVNLIMTADDYSLVLRLSGANADDLTLAQESVATHVDRVTGEDAGVRCAWQQIS